MVVGCSTKVFRNGLPHTGTWRDSGDRALFKMDATAPTNAIDERYTSTASDSQRGQQHASPQISTRAKPASSMCRNKQFLAQHRLLIHSS